jgi:hypothetical protein
MNLLIHKLQINFGDEFTVNIYNFGIEIGKDTTYSFQIVTNNLTKYYVTMFT